MDGPIDHLTVIDSCVHVTKNQNMTFGGKGFKVIWLVSILWMVNKKFDETNLKPK